MTDNAWKSNSLELWNLLIETQDQMIDSDRKDNRRHQKENLCKTLGRDLRGEK